jgi:hypothetical protein
MPQRGALLGAQPELPADQPGLVGVDDVAVGRPEFDADDGVAEDVPADHPVQPGARRFRRAREERVAQRRLYGGVGQQVGNLRCGVDCLALGGTASGDHTHSGDEADDQRRDQPDLHEHPARADRPLVGSGGAAVGEGHPGGGRLAVVRRTRRWPGCRIGGRAPAGRAHRGPVVGWHGGTLTRDLLSDGPNRHLHPRRGHHLVQRGRLGRRGHPGRTLRCSYGGRLGH